MKLLVTGHGGFAPGFKEATRMIAGEQEAVTWLAFEEGANLSDYQEEIKQQIQDCQASGQGLLILTDLKGGTPFNVSMLLAQGQAEVEVLAGTNLAMILEAVLTAPFANSVHDLADQLVATGQAGLVKGSLTPVAEDCTEEDGI